MKHIKTILFLVVLAFGNMGIAAALTSNYTTYSIGQTLTAASLNGLQTNYTDGDNNILNGDTFTGNMLWNSGVDILLYSDAGLTLTGSIEGSTGEAILAVKNPGGIVNLNIINATTTNANDSIRLQCGGATCSATNPGFLWMPSTATAGSLTLFRITTDVTLNLTGAHWGVGTTGDITGMILRWIPVNDNGTLRHCIAYLGGRTTVLTTDTNATATNINLPEELFCNSAVTSATNTAIDIGWFRTNFDDTGGAAEDLHAVQTGVNDLNIGKSADGYYQPWNAIPTWFAVNPTVASSRWTSHGRKMFLHYESTGGTSNAGTFTITSAPAKAAITNDSSPLTQYEDNSVIVRAGGIVNTTAGSVTLILATTAGASSWTAANAKNANFSLTYEMGPTASFIE